MMTRPMHDPNVFSLFDPWLPVRTATGRQKCIAPCQIGELSAIDDPVLAFTWGRADFDVASCEFMIGLLTTALGSDLDEERWLEWWEQPPSAEVLQALFAKLDEAFVLDAPNDAPCFLQDRSRLSDGEAWEIQRLLIDQAGAAPLFTRSGQVRNLSRAAAAMALYTLQSWAPAGGRGHRTSLRGGGPFVTLVEPRWRNAARPVSIWHRIWLNVVPLPDAGVRPDARFPWLRPTRTSEKGEATTPVDVDPLQAFWGMPRRIRLNFEPNRERLPCDVTGEVDEVIVRNFRARHGGTNYVGWSRRHPLTPYYRVKATDVEWLPAHPQPRRVCHRDWVGLVVGDAKGDVRNPALAVQMAAQRLRDVTGVQREGRLQVAGYDMDNMKARGFVEATLPILVVPELHERAVAFWARALIQASDVAARIVKGAVRHALDLEANDKGVVAMAGERVWEATEAPFFANLRELVPDEDRDEEAVDRDGKEMRAAWREQLRREAIGIFDQLCPLDPARPRGIQANAQARKRLGQAFYGYGKEGADLFGALGLAPPESKKKGGKKTK